MKTSGPGKHVLIAICAVFVALFLVLPLIFVLVQAFKDGIMPYLANIGDYYALKALGLTIKTMVICLIVNTIIGIIAAWTVTRYQFRLKKVLTTFLDIPLSVSPIIAGLLYILTFGRSSILYPFLSSHNISIVYAVPGIVLVTIFVTLPYISREIIPVLEAKGTDEESAAALMGAGAMTIFRKITFPHIKWSLLYGAVLCAARAMGEFGAVSIISGHLRGVTNTLPLHIEILYNEFKYAPAFAVSSLLVFVAIVLLIIRNVAELQGKKREEEV